MNYLHQEPRRLCSGADERHFCPTTPMADMRELHLYYPLATLQKEIEKRTFYLGKYRRSANADGTTSAEAPHLLDLIGMSRDEGDVLYSFAKGAMADVYDVLNRSTPGYPKIYDWEDKKADTITLNSRESCSGYFEPDHWSPSLSAVIGGTDNTKVIVSGTITLYGTLALSTNTSRLPQFVLEVTVNKQRVLKSDPTQTFTSQEKVRVQIDRDHVLLSNTLQAALEFTILPYEITPNIQEETYYVTAESIASASVEFKGQATEDAVTLIAEPVSLVAGSRFTFTGDATVYETRESTDENQLRGSELPDYVKPLAANDAYFEEGIHYYLGMPAYLNESLINPLDNAIFEALVNRIIWKWLCMSFPSEAQAYDTFYQQAIASLRERCNVFNKNWVNRKPRMY